MTNHRINLLIEDDDAPLLKRLAELTDRNQSSVVRQLIRTEAAHRGLTSAKRPEPRSPLKATPSWLQRHREAAKNESK